MVAGTDTAGLWTPPHPDTINYLDIVDDELLDASQEFYEKHSSLYGIEKLL